ncbi:MAG TPA: hypothetical protein VMW10_03270, partial [Alphaproteobacteria bacterium]|nr:hypothetical protein [Alphaproteobacteria bacterium]
MLKTNNVLRKFSIKLISGFTMVLPNEVSTQYRLCKKKYHINNLRNLILKQKCTKRFICIFLIFSIFYAPLYATKSEYYRFTPEIYDQKKLVIRSSSLPKDELNEKLMDELLIRKKEQLEKNFLKRIKDSVDELEEELREASKGQFRKKVIDTLKEAGASAALVGMIAGAGGGGAIAGTAVGGPVGTLIGLGLGVGAGIIASVGAEYLKEKLNKNKRYRRNPQEIIKKMDELKEKCEELIKGLDYEPIADLERRYVIKKRGIANLSL